MRNGVGRIRVLHAVAVSARGAEGSVLSEAMAVRGGNDSLIMRNGPGKPLALRARCITGRVGRSYD